MKIVCVSDTHDQHEKVIIPECDILIHAGDFTCHRVPQIKKYIDFNTWLNKQPAKYKIVIAGNHDTLCEQHPVLARSLLSNAIYLENGAVSIDGLKFYGSPHTRFWDNWAFNIKGEAIEDVWKRIPDDTDVLITHMPPYGIRDININGTHANGNCGCEYLKRRCFQLNTKLHIFGHIHEGYGQEGKYVNASQVDEFNNMKNSPVIINL